MTNPKNSGDPPSTVPAKPWKKAGTLLLAEALSTTS
jgi:hypothetical protein